MATATERRAAQGLVIGNGHAGNVKSLCSTVELAASADGTTIDFGNIPAGARILGSSTVYWDDLASSGAPTLDLGLAAVDSNITSDPDALSNGHDVAGGAGSADVIADHADFGKAAWEHVSGQASDPGGELQVYGSIVDAATNQTGTVTIDLYYIVD